MVTEAEVHALIARLRHNEPVARDTVAEVLEQLLPSFYGYADTATEGTCTLEGAVPESGMVMHLMPLTAWDEC